MVELNPGYQDRFADKRFNADLVLFTADELVILGLVPDRMRDEIAAVQSKRATRKSLSEVPFSAVTKDEELSTRIDPQSMDSEGVAAILGEELTAERELLNMVPDLTLPERLVLQLRESSQVDAPYTYRQAGLWIGRSAAVVREIEASGLEKRRSSESFRGKEGLHFYTTHI